MTAIAIQPASSPLSLYLWRLTAHVIWIGIFAVPFVVFPALRFFERSGIRRSIVLFVMLSGLSFVGSIGFLEAQQLGSAFGEMQLGWFAMLMPFRGGLEITAGLLCLVGIIALVDLVVWTFADLRSRYLLCVWILVGISLQSLVRPTNRYVLFLLPPLALYLGNIAVSALRPPFRVATAEVARFVNSHRLEGVEGGYNNSVWSHSFYLVQPERLVQKPDEKTKYQILTLHRSETIPGIIFESPVRIGGVTFKRYAIVRNPPVFVPQ